MLLTWKLIKLGEFINIRNVAIKNNNLWTRKFFYLILNITKELNIPAGKYLFKINNRNCRKSCEICSKLIIKAPDDAIERRLWLWCLFWCFSPWKWLNTEFFLFGPYFRNRAEYRGLQTECGKILTRKNSTCHVIFLLLGQFTHNNHINFD